METTKPTKANNSPWRPNFTIAPGNKRRTHKVSTAINKLAIKKEAQNALFANGFRGVIH